MEATGILRTGVARGDTENDMVRYGGSKRKVKVKSGFADIRHHIPPPEKALR